MMLVHGLAMLIFPSPSRGTLMSFNLQLEVAQRAFLELPGEDGRHYLQMLAISGAAGEQVRCHLKRRLHGNSRGRPSRVEAAEYRVARSIDFRVGQRIVRGC
jgi:hypothetical protein